MAQGTFNADFTTGLTATLTVPFAYFKSGRMVWVWNTARVTGVSNSVFFFTGANALPAFLWPEGGGTVSFYTDALDNNIAIGARIGFNGLNGAIIIGASPLTTLSNNWTATGTKGYPAATTGRNMFSWVTV